MSHQECLGLQVESLDVRYIVIYLSCIQLPDTPHHPRLHFPIQYASAVALHRRPPLAVLKAIAVIYLHLFWPPGSLLAPYVVLGASTHLGGGASAFAIFACLSFAAAAVQLVLPETKGVQLPDTWQ